jgi:hypothetical protein
MNFMKYFACVVASISILSSCVGNGSGKIACFSEPFDGDSSILYQNQKTYVSGSRAGVVSDPFLTASAGGCGIRSINVDTSPVTGSISVTFTPSTRNPEQKPVNAYYEFGENSTSPYPVENSQLSLSATTTRGVVYGDMEFGRYEQFGALRVAYTNELRGFWLAVRQEVQLLR